ncbi:MAG: hypothetical protein HQL88_02705 [Magnetococcales bacterium]|nr:hypothetical protein [Magnetococcales bacterium]
MGGLLALLTLGWSAPAPVQAAGRAQTPTESKKPLPGQQGDQETRPAGEIVPRGEAYRGHFGWSDGNEREIDPGDESSQGTCRRPTDTMTLQLWDGNGRCLSDADPNRQPDARNRGHEEEGEP